MTCDGVCTALRTLYPEFDVVGVHNGHAARKAMATPQMQWVLALCDLALPDIDGLELVREIRERHEVPVVVFTGHDDPITVQASKNAGAAGFVKKSANMDMLRATLHTILESGASFPDTPLSAKPGVLAHLTVRQKQVLDLLLDGLPNKTIASRLNLADGTVRNLLSELFDRFEITARSRASLVAEVTKLGYKSTKKT